MVVNLPQVGRNAPCPCGSGKKYKICCARAAEPPALVLASWVDRWIGAGREAFEAGDVDGAIDRFRSAVEADPNVAAAQEGLSLALQARAQFDAALRSAQRAVELCAGTAAESAAAHALMACIGRYQRHLFDLGRGADPQRAFEEHVRFGRGIEQLLGPPSREHGNPPDPQRRLRIGYLSPDFRRHPVAYFLEPVLARHDRSRVEIFCYYSAPLHDEITRRFRSLADRWLDCERMTPHVLAGCIRNDGVDVLVDLAGHTVGNRALTLALKPAPVQIAWLGYPATTGLTGVDYRITDAWADPPGLADRYFVERPLRLEPTMSVYHAPLGAGGLLGAAAPATGEAPIVRNGFATFGCFGALSKFNDLLLSTWARLLAQVPDSRLILKAREFTGDAAPSAAIRERFRSLCIAPERIDFLGRDEDPAVHLTRYCNIDICLDTFPYAGVTTSHDAVWMGVPFITLAGRTPAARMGVSIAANLGHLEWIATSADDYVARAAALAAEPQRIAALRRSLRERHGASPLADAESFVRKLEAAYRQAWCGWCAAAIQPLSGQPPPSHPQLAVQPPRDAQSDHFSR